MLQRQKLELALPEYAPVEKMPARGSVNALESAKIINHEIEQQTHNTAQFTKAIQINPENVLAWYNRGLAYMHIKQHSKAIADFSEAISRGYTAAYVTRGIAYSEIRQFSKAAADFAEVNERPKMVADQVLFATSLHHRCVIANRQQSPSSEIDLLYAEILELFPAPTHPKIQEIVAIAYVERAAIAQSDKQYEQARSLLSEIIAQYRDTTHPRVRIRVVEALGILFDILSVDLKDFDAAIEVAADIHDNFKGDLTPIELHKLEVVVLVGLAADSVNYANVEQALELINKAEEKLRGGPDFDGAAEVRELVAKMKAPLVHHSSPASVARALLEKKDFRTAWELLAEVGPLTINDTTFTPRDLFERQVERYIQRYYSVPGSLEDNPGDDGYDVPEQAITEQDLLEVILDAAREMASRFETSPAFPLLSDKEIAAVKAHAKKNLWADRSKRGWDYHTNVFKFLHITYRVWVNRGLTREIISKADPALHAALNVKMTKEGGMPEWLDVPTGAEARLRAITDPTERLELELFRKRQRRIQREHAARKSLGD